MQRTMDIEDLLGWTYQAQLADIVIERGYGLHPIGRPPPITIARAARRRPGVTAGAGRS